MANALTDDEIEKVLEQLIEYQRARVLAHARRIDPKLTEDDVWNPIDFPALQENAKWNYEDGILAGYRSAQMALRARLRRDG